MLEVIEAEKINVITESKHHTNKPLSRVSFIETPPVLCSLRNSKLEPSLDTVEEITEISVTQEYKVTEETDSDNTAITIMDEIINNVTNELNQTKTETQTQTILEDIDIKVEESKSFKNKFVNFYKNIKNKFSCFMKNI